MCSQAVHRFRTQHYPGNLAILSHPQHQASIASCANISVSITPSSPFLLLFLTAPSNFSPLTTRCLSAQAFICPRKFMVFLGFCFVPYSLGSFHFFVTVLSLTLFLYSSLPKRRFSGLRKAPPKREHYLGQRSPNLLGFWPPIVRCRSYGSQLQQE